MRKYLDTLDADNPVHRSEARYLSPTDPVAAWNVKEGRGKFGYFNNYLIDTDYAVILDWLAEKLLLVATVQNLHRLVRLRPPTTAAPLVSRPHDGKQGAK